MSASSLSLPIFVVTDSQNTFYWHTQRALLNDKKAGAGCTSRAFKHPGHDVTAPDVWPSILTDYTYDSELDNADGVPLAFRRSSMFPEGNTTFCTQNAQYLIYDTISLKYGCVYVILHLISVLVFPLRNAQRLSFIDQGTWWSSQISFQIFR